MKTADCLVEYFVKEIELLHEAYSWPIPQIDGFSLSGCSGYYENVELKKHFHSRWNALDHDGRVALSKTVVSDWGGVHGNKLETLEKYVSDIEKNSLKTIINGVASYSKILSVVDMNNYAIYDARVASCLNAVQVNSKISDGIAFNYVPGRNNITGNVNNGRGFSREKQFSVSYLVNEHGWKRINRDYTYATYLDVMKICLSKIPSCKLYDLEMILFSNAERECKKAMDSLGIQ